MPSIDMGGNKHRSLADIGESLKMFGKYNAASFSSLFYGHRRLHART